MVSYSLEEIEAPLEGVVYTIKGFPVKVRFCCVQDMIWAACPDFAALGDFEALERFRRTWVRNNPIPGTGVMKSEIFMRGKDLDTDSYSNSWFVSEEGIRLFLDSQRSVSAEASYKCSWLYSLMRVQYVEKVLDEASIILQRGF